MFTDSYFTTSSKPRKTHQLAQNIIGTKMLMCTCFIVVIAVAFSVYVGFSNLAKVVEMEGTLKARKFTNLFHDEAPVDDQPSIFTRSDPMWFSSYYNSIRYKKRPLFTFIFESTDYNIHLHFNLVRTTRASAASGTLKTARMLFMIPKKHWNTIQRI